MDKVKASSRSRWGIAQDISCSDAEFFAGDSFDDCEIGVPGDFGVGTTPSATLKTFMNEQKAVQGK